MLFCEDRITNDSSAAPNPTRLDRLIELEAVDAQRHVFCDRYERCLDSAIDDDWPSWTCKSCPRFGIAALILMGTTPDLNAVAAPDSLSSSGSVCAA